MSLFDREGRLYGFEFIYYERDFYHLGHLVVKFERFMVGNNVMCDVVELGKKMTLQIFACWSPKLLLEGKGFRDLDDLPRHRAINNLAGDSGRAAPL
jgi:hypothetical protein